MGRHTLQKTAFQPKQLNSRHREVIRRLVYLNQKQSQIARDLGFNESHLSVIVNTPIFKSELEKARREKDYLDRSAYIESLADPAIRVVKDILTKGQAEFPDRTVKVGATVLMETVRDVLDRSGHKPIERKIEAHVDVASSIIEAWGEDPKELEAQDAEILALAGPQPEDQNVDTSGIEEAYGAGDATAKDVSATGLGGLPTLDSDTSGSLASEEEKPAPQPQRGEDKTNGSSQPPF